MSSPHPTHPAVRCTGCAYEWHSASMAEGLRLLGSCPRCSGTLDFAANAFSPTGGGAGSVQDHRAPHLVLGVPRR